MTGRWVVLEPLDTVAVRDGRGFDMGFDAAAHLALPSPATFAGAIGALYDPAAPGLARADPSAVGTRLPSEVHGPITVRHRSGRWQALFPVPHDVTSSGRELSRLEPPGGKPSLQHDLDGEVEVLFTDRSGAAVPGEDHWWDAGQLADYLHEGMLSDPLPTPPWRVERRVGIAREEARTVTEGMFYSAEHLRPGPGVGFAGRCVGGPPKSLGGTVAFGGEGRRAEVHGDVPGIEFPAAPEDFDGGRLLLYLATPAVFPGSGWRPELAPLAGDGEPPRLVAAAVGATRVITTGTADRRSGAFRNGRIMWAAPAGAVYYLRFPGADAAKAAAERIHGTTIKQAEDWMRTAGFGLVLTGRWTEGS